MTGSTSSHHVVQVMQQETLAMWMKMQVHTTAEGQGKEKSQGSR